MTLNHPSQQIWSSNWIISPSKGNKYLSYHHLSNVSPVSDALKSDAILVCKDSDLNETASIFCRFRRYQHCCNISDQDSHGEITPEFLEKAYQFARIHSPNTHHALEKMQLFHIESQVSVFLCISDGFIWRILVIPWHSRKLSQTLEKRLEKKDVFDTPGEFTPRLLNILAATNPPVFVSSHFVSSPSTPHHISQEVWGLYGLRPGGGPAMIYMCIYVCIYIYINRGINASSWGGNCFQKFQMLLSITLLHQIMEKASYIT